MNNKWNDAVGNSIEKKKEDTVQKFNDNCEKIQNRILEIKEEQMSYSRVEYKSNAYKIKEYWIDFNG